MTTRSPRTTPSVSRALTRSTADRPEDVDDAGKNPNQHDSTPPKQDVVIPTGNPAGIEAGQDAGTPVIPEVPAAPKKIKRTYYMTRDEAQRLKDFAYQKEKDLGQRFTLSDAISEAIAAYIADSTDETSKPA